MPKDFECADEPCTACGAILKRVYDELRQSGYDDRAAFASAVRVLELRHPGHDGAYYRRRAADLIGERG